MTEEYLILHKVRGEAAFDVATKIDISDEEGWIIPTSGHRAYPVWWYELYKLDITEKMVETSGMIPPFTIEPDWPDHYQVNASPKAERLAATSLLTELGLPTKIHSSVSGTLKRRI